MQHLLAVHEDRMHPAAEEARLAPLVRHRVQRLVQARTHERATDERQDEFRRGEGPSDDVPEGATHRDVARVDEDLVLRLQGIAQQLGGVRRVTTLVGDEDLHWRSSPAVRRQPDTSTSRYWPRGSISPMGSQPVRSGLSM